MQLLIASTCRRPIAATNISLRRRQSGAAEQSAKTRRNDDAALINSDQPTIDATIGRRSDNAQNDDQSERPEHAQSPRHANERRARLAFPLNGDDDLFVFLVVVVVGHTSRPLHDSFLLDSTINTTLVTNNDIIIIYAHQQAAEFRQQ